MYILLAIRITDSPEDVCVCVCEIIILRELRTNEVREVELYNFACDPIYFLIDAREVKTKRNSYLRELRNQVSILNYISPRDSTD